MVNIGEILLSDTAEIFTGKDIESKQRNDKGYGYPYIMGASSMQGGRLIKRVFTEHTDRAVMSYEGDILISAVGTLGKIAYNDIGDCCISKHIICVRCNDGFLPLVMYYYLLFALPAYIPPDDGMKYGFSRKLDIDTVRNIPVRMKQPVSGYLISADEYRRILYLLYENGTFGDDISEVRQIVESGAFCVSRSPPDKFIDTSSIIEIHEPNACGVLDMDFEELFK